MWSGDYRLAGSRVARGPGQGVEQLGHVLGYLAVGCEEAEVLIQARGLRVVVAGSDVDVMAHALALAADHEQRLGVRLEAGETVHHVGARLLEGTSPSRCCGARRSAP